MKFNKLYVDGDILLYEIAFATQKQLYYIYVEGVLAWIGSDKRKINSMFKGIDYSYEKYLYIQPLICAINTYEQRLKTYAKKFGTKDIKVVLTGDKNFRDGVATTKPYKGTRKQDKPDNYAALKEYMIDRGAIVTDNEEADDYISYMTCNRYDTLAITIDKDAINTPSYIYNHNKEKLIHVTKRDADKNFWYQVIVGDTVDNIPGLPNYGIAWAKENLSKLETYKELEQAVALAYACHPEINDPEEYLLEQGMLLWMRRKPDEVWSIGYE